MMEAAEKPRLRVSIISDSAQQRSNLLSLFQSSDMHVVMDGSFKEHSIEDIHPEEADVVVLDLDDEVDYDLEIFDEILNSKLPVIFNDSAVSRDYSADKNSPWAKSLINKLLSMGKPATSKATTEVVAEVQPEAETSEQGVEPEEDAVLEMAEAVDKDVLQPEERNVEMVRRHSLYNAARQVWVLGSSIGGPQAIRRFLGAIPGNLPIAFVLAQHIGKGFEELLARQLDRSSEFDVMYAESGHQLRHRQVVITPVNKRVLVDKRGCLLLKPADPDGIYTPSIDAAMIDMAVHYGKMSGAIIFSGMGRDGMQGCRVMAARGATVLAQDAGTCVVSGMPDAARRCGVVSFSGTPEQLAEKLVERFNV
ncbi:MAG: chemotaxis protein CheB [Gammaproteobacteria bacterium]|nr:MAG: chemotaxis protein CheB [Gammaproteobacteria bacterium]